MNIEQTLLKNLRELPPEKQRAETWKSWAENQSKDSPGLPNYALKRETIY